MYVMDKFNLASDPCDRRIIRFNNFMQLLACVRNCAEIKLTRVRPESPRRWRRDVASMASRRRGDGVEASRRRVEASHQYR